MQAASRLRCAAGPHVGYCDATAGGATMTKYCIRDTVSREGLEPN